MQAREVYGQIAWKPLETAQEMSATSPKPIFIEFTAKWCGWCKKMDKTTFQDNKVIEMLNNDFYAVRVDFDSKSPLNFKGDNYTGKELAKMFGIEGLPTMIYLPANLEDADKIIGYKSAKQLLKKLNQLKFQ